MEGSSNGSSDFSDTQASFKYPRQPKRDLDEIFYDHIRENLPDQVTIQNNSLITKNIQNLFQDLQSQMPDHDMSLSRLAPYGSQLTGLALKNSDIDMTLLTHNDEPNLVAKNLFLAMVKQDDRYFRKFGFLQKFQIRLSHHPAHGLDFLSFSQIRTSETPEIQQSMDLTINGFDVVRESLIIKKMVEVSPTLKNLIFLLKRWTRHYKRKNRMNIYAYYIMAIHFLQKVVHPRILPPFDLNQLDDFPMNVSYDPYAMNPIIEDLSAPKISHLLKEFFKYYGEDYHKGDFGPISIETIDGQGVEELTFNEKNCLFNILVPFGGHRPGNELNIGTSKAEKHKEEMLKAYQSIEAKTNIFSKEYVRENRQIVKIRNIMEHQGTDIFLNKKEKKLMERLRKQDSSSEETRIKVDTKSEEGVSADIRGNILQESVAEQARNEQQNLISHSLEMLGKKDFKFVHYIPKRAFRSSARQEVLLQRTMGMMRFLSK